MKSEINCLQLKHKTKRAGWNHLPTKQACRASNVDRSDTEIPATEFAECTVGPLKMTQQKMKTVKNMARKCRRHHLGSNLVRIGSEKPSPQDEDLPGNDPHWFPGFLYLGSGMSPEWFRSDSVLAGSEETRKAWRAPKMRLSDLLNSWDNFVVTLSSISSDTWVV